MKVYNAIVFFKPETKIKTRKYRNISQVDKFFKYCIKEGAWYANIYSADTKAYLKRYYFTSK
jgi:hypothetical protein